MKITTCICIYQVIVCRYLILYNFVHYHVHCAQCSKYFALYQSLLKMLHIVATVLQLKFVALLS